MALRMLSDAAKIPLDQHLNGIVTLNGTFNDIPRTFILDTTYPGLAHTCKFQTLYSWASDYNETCPTECSSNLTIPVLSSHSGVVQVDPFASNLTFADVSLPNFKSGRICDSKRRDAFSNLDTTANGVFGLGPETPKAFPDVIPSLDIIPWTKYSIYLAKTVQDAGSFLLPGGIDADMIAKQSLVETTLPATTEKGWTVNIDDFTTTGAAIKANCSPTNPCKATVASSSPVIQLGKDLWNSVIAGMNKLACRRAYVGDYFVHECYDTTKLPTLTFTLGDRTFTMNMTDYTVPIPKSETRSVYVMIASDNRNLSYASEWILGTPFLRKYYASFDNETKTVSFYCKEGVDCSSNKAAHAPGASSTSGAQKLGLGLALATTTLAALAV